MPARAREDPWLDEKLHVARERNIPGDEDDGPPSDDGDDGPPPDDGDDGPPPDDGDGDDDDGGSPDDSDGDDPIILNAPQIMIWMAMWLSKIQHSRRRHSGLLINAYVHTIPEQTTDLDAVIVAGMKLGRHRTHSLFVTIPDSGGVQVRKSKLVQLVVECRSQQGNSKNSADRLIRVQRAARKAAIQSVDNVEDEDGDKLSVGNNAAFVFRDKFGRSKLSFGLVTKILSGKPHKSKNDICFSKPPSNCYVRCQWYTSTSDTEGHYQVAVDINKNNSVPIHKCLGVVIMEQCHVAETTGVVERHTYRVLELSRWMDLAKQREPSAQLINRQKRWRESHVQEARDLEKHYRGNAAAVSSRRLRSQRRMGVSTTPDMRNSRDLQVDMRVRLFYEGRVYGLGWGHRELEYRRTTVIVSSIDEQHVCFCIHGLRSYKEGYVVKIKRADVNAHATCLDDWYAQHPEDMDPRTVHV